MTTQSKTIQGRTAHRGISYKRWVISTTLATGLLVPAMGCRPAVTNPAEATAGGSSQAEAEQSPIAADISVATENEELHGHKPGQHGGIIVSLGRDSYHIEAVIEDGGTVRLYTLGNDESRVIDIESQTLKGYVKQYGGSESRQIEFKPAPQDGDAANRTSLFVGNLPAELVGKQIDITVPNITISSERFRLGFTSFVDNHDDDMPDAIGVEEERELYLASAGHYTDADIAANGNTIPSVKFKGIRSAHDMNPKPGDNICPITQTKANPKFTWVIDGNPYEFCCPPCIDEFVRMAKDSAEPMPTPDRFVKQ